MQPVATTVVHDRAVALVNRLVPLSFNGYIKGSVQAAVFRPQDSTSEAWRDVYRMALNGFSEQASHRFKSAFSLGEQLVDAPMIAIWWEGGFSANARRLTQQTLKKIHHISVVGRWKAEHFARLGRMKIVERRGQGVDFIDPNDIGLEGMLSDLVAERKATLTTAEIYYPAKVVKVRIEGNFHYLCLMQNSDRLASFLLDPEVSSIQEIEGQRVPEIRQSEFESIRS